MVASGHVQIIFVDTFPCNQSHDTLDWEWATIHKISIKEIFVLLAWVTINFEDIH